MHTLALNVSIVIYVPPLGVDLGFFLCVLGREWADKFLLND